MQISEMANDFEAQLIDRLKNGTLYALQIDESVRCGKSSPTAGFYSLCLGERLGYIGNPRSLKEGTETYVGLTDE